MAYDVMGDQKTVLRGGIGLFYDRPFGNSVISMPGNPPGTAATTHEVSNAIQTTQNKFLQYSPALDSAKPTGIRPMMVTKVPASMGAAVWLQA